MFLDKSGAEVQTYALRCDAAGNELQTVWNVEIVDEEFGKFVRLSNKEFGTVKYEEVTNGPDDERREDRADAENDGGKRDCA